ncbi:hypothetical protein D3C81_765180 [compost metagenome]
MMLRDLFVAEVLYKHRQEQLHQVTLHAWKHLRKRDSLKLRFSLSLFSPKQSVCCEPCC